MSTINACGEKAHVEIHHIHIGVSLKDLKDLQLLHSFNTEDQETAGTGHREWPSSELRGGHEHHHHQDHRQRSRSQKHTRRSARSSRGSEGRTHEAIIEEPRDCLKRKCDIFAPVHDPVPKTPEGMFCRTPNFNFQSMPMTPPWMISRP